MAKDFLHTKLCDMIGSRLPICAFSPDREVTAAVSKAGGLGVLAGALRNLEELETDIHWLREQLGSTPFGIDLLLPSSSPPSGTTEELMAQIPETHRAFVQKLKEENNIPAAKSPPLFYKLGWVNQDRARAQVDLVLEERVPVLAFGLGSPNFILEAAHARGIKVFGLVGKPRQAEREIAAGVDAVIAQGSDAAGHTGNIGTFSIVPAVAAAAGDTPVLAAGGVTTGRHVAAALCLGAAGVWTGTIWLASKESQKDPIIKQKIIAAGTDDTTHSTCVSGFSMRVTKSKWTEAWEAPDAPRPLAAPYQLLLAGELHQAAVDYKIESFMLEACGQGAGFVTEEKSVADIMQTLEDDARATLDAVTSGTPLGALS
jgi:NAD(P)H-dependent flavin oxidoreductase YrpB (nitropropane dioxygenase family)